VDHVSRTPAGQDLTIQEGRGVVRTFRTPTSQR